MNSRDEYSADILLYLDNELSGSELEDFWAHLMDCAGCQRRLEEEQALSDLLNRSRPLYSAPEALRAQVAAAAAAQQTTVVSHAPNRLRRRVLRMLTRPLRHMTQRPTLGKHWWPRFW
jgi:mycothiol system anti-sigma-R factor